MILSDAIFDLLQGTYGLDADTIATRLAASAAAVRTALDQMLVEGRLWETAEGKYRCVLPPAPWLEAVKEALVCEGWPGLAYLYIPEDLCLELYPVPFVQEGVEPREICFMSHWHVDLEELLALFDEHPAVAFGATSQDGTSFSVEGTIGGVDAWIQILDRPPEGLAPELLMTSDGSFRELSEEEQEEYEQRSHESDDGEDDEPPRLRGLWRPSDN
jgi:hypothetical protein